MSPLQRFSYAWYAHAFLRELVLIYPTSAIMMTGSGVSPLELSTLFMIWGLAALIGEIPSGAIADASSRRNILVGSGLMKGCAFLIWLVFPSYVGFAAGYVVWGTASAMASGAGEALLFDTLGAQAETRQFAKIYGRGQALGNLGIATALLIGGFAAQPGYEVPLVASALAPWAAAMVALATMHEPPRSRVSDDSGDAQSFVDTLRAAAIELKRNRAVGFVVVMFGVLATLYGAIEEYISVFLRDEGGLALGSIGAIYAATYLARTVGLEVAHRIPGLPVPNAIRLFIAAGVLLGTTQAGSGAWLALPLASYACASGIAEVLLQTRLQHGIEGSSRATVTSAAGVVEALFEFPLYLSIGLAAQYGGWQTAFTMIAGATVVLTLTFRALAPPEALR